MIQGLRGATIWSEDLDKLLPFYRDLLGLLGRDPDRRASWCSATPGAPSLALGTHSEVHGRNLDPARHMVGLGSDDVDADWTRLAAPAWSSSSARRTTAAPDRDPEGSRGQPDPAPAAHRGARR